MSGILLVCSFLFLGGVAVVVGKHVCHGQAAWVVCGIYIYMENKNDAIFGIQTQNPRYGSIYPSLDHCKHVFFVGLKLLVVFGMPHVLEKYVLSLFWLNHPISKKISKFGCSMSEVGGSL